MATFRQFCLNNFKKEKNVSDFDTLTSSTTLLSFPKSCFVLLVCFVFVFSFFYLKYEETETPVFHTAMFLSWAISDLLRKVFKWLKGTLCFKSNCLLKALQKAGLTAQWYNTWLCSRICTQSLDL